LTNHKVRARARRYRSRTPKWRGHTFGGDPQSPRSAPLWYLPRRRTRHPRAPFPFARRRARHRNAV